MKQRLNLSVETDLIDRAKAVGLNLSSFFEFQLRRILPLLENDIETVASGKDIVELEANAINCPECGEFVFDARRITWSGGAVFTCPNGHKFKVEDENI